MRIVSTTSEDEIRTSVGTMNFWDGFAALPVVRCGLCAVRGLPRLAANVGAVFFLARRSLKMPVSNLGCFRPSLAVFNSSSLHFLEKLHAVRPQLFYDAAADVLATRLEIPACSFVDHFRQTRRSAKLHQLRFVLHFNPLPSCRATKTCPAIDRRITHLIYR
jgi:hypothetical protein